MIRSIYLTGLCGILLRLLINEGEIKSGNPKIVFILAGDIGDGDVSCLNDFMVTDKEINGYELINHETENSNSFVLMGTN